MSQSTWLSESDSKLIRFVLATLPYVVLGGLLRVVQDAGMIQGDIQFLLVTPFIYFVIFFFTIGMLFLSRTLLFRGLRKIISHFIQLQASCQHLSFHSFCIMGHQQCPRRSLYPRDNTAYGYHRNVSVWAFMRYVLRWKYVSDPLYIILLFGQLLDASATSYGIDLHPAVRYIEQHVVGSGLIDLTHTAFVMFPLKLVVLFPAIYVMEMYRKEANPAFWHLVLLAMIAVGFAPGIRDMVRMVLYV